MFIKEPVHQLEDVVLSEENGILIDQILLEHRRSDVIKSYGLRNADKLLFYGPPGCGKTLTTEIIASELNLPFAIIRIESVISSYLGETAANLRKIFDFIDATPMVVLFDEFDALAKERSDAGDHGELKRVVNTVLQMMDAYIGKSLIVAATNREVILDEAIWRRFEEVLFFGMPDQGHIRKLLPVKLRGVRCEFSADDVEVAELFNGMSHADIERTLRRAIKDMILCGQEFLRKGHIKKALDREKARQHRLKQS
jgi:SpoVK/Ycf46/Vps4 family AAA+-type ATPase